MTSYVPLSFVDLALSATLLIANLMVSFRYRLKLEQSLAIAALRMIVQLVAVALLLRFLFEQTSPVWSIAFALLMAGGAILEVITRQHYRFKSWTPLLVTASPAFFAGLLTTLVAIAVIGPSPWYAPRFLLPILGMLTGNTLSGVTLVLDALTSGAERERRVIEEKLALGATRLEAFDEILRRSLRTGMIPALNAMAAAGIVSLPGMMTGQILAGIDPLEAAKYQILIMFLIAGATAIAVLSAGLIAVHFITDDRHRLRLDYLVPAKD